MRSHIPNFLTVTNLLCGCVGIIMAFEGKLDYAAFLIWTAAVFDFFDGFSARLLKVKSHIGKELDSLADMVSFGVLPSIIMFFLIAERTENPYLPYIGFMIAAFSALRLAKFNVDERQSESFVGLPTPANAFFISSIPFILARNYLNLEEFISVGILVIICIILSFLLVAELPLFSLKFKDLSWQNNAFRYIFALISGILLLVLNVMAFPLIIVVYLVLSLVSNIRSKT